MRWVILGWTVLVLGMWLSDISNMSIELKDNPFLGVGVGLNTIIYFALWAIIAGPLALLWAMFRRRTPRNQGTPG